ncbi:MAG: OmpH family outer membrane protein [Pirellulaceae bacterium]
MRKSLLFATIVAGMLIGTVANAQGPTGAARPAAARGTNVAVVDIGFIFKNATRFKQAMDDIKADDERFKQEVVAKQEAMQAAVQNLQKMQKGSTDYKILEEQIAGDQTKLRLDMARKQKDRVEQEAKVYFNAYREVESHINKFATTYGIDLVLRFNAEEMDPSQPESVLNGINRFVVYQRDLNITGHILDQMNRDTPPRTTNGNNRPPFQPPR